ncbi:NECA3 protein, partial [Chordeiles acutipennis]|nr:NECA3 protein [Chordeiles acutipennis]
MACAELLAVCLLSAERGPAPRRRQPLPIFHDVSTATDRAPYIIILPFYLNADDGKLSFEEFKNYFADGILSSEELWELFSGIDRHHSDPASLSAHSAVLWFLCHLRSWAQGLATGKGVWCDSWAGLPSCFPRYETSSKMEQFLTRFLLRETLQQLQSLQTSLECAVDTVEEQAGRERKDIKKSEIAVGLRPGRRCGRRGQKNICLAPTDPYSGMLTTGICSLPVPWVGVSAPLEPGRGVGAAAAWDSRALSGMEPGPSHPDASWSFCGCSVPACRVPGQGHSCPHSVSACKLTDEPCFILYEFWQDVTSWRSHLQSSCSKTFQRAIISLLESPELLTTMLFPASWWIMNNN